MEDSKEETKAWREVKKKGRWVDALRGFHVFVKTTRSLYTHIPVAILVIIFGFYFNVSKVEWMMLVFAIGFVLVTEALNTAIEIDIDLTSPDYHPFAKDTKDVAAAAVLLSVITAVVIGLIVFLPKIF
jgi:undecaprenol kinase